MNFINVLDQDVLIPSGQNVAILFVNNIYMYIDDNNNNNNNNNNNRSLAHKIVHEDVIFFGPKMC